MSARTRHVVDKLGTAILVAALGVTLVPLFSILWLVISRGAGAATSPSPTLRPDDGK